ncbi:hypothetical protein M8J77_000586 [Diaphorina citri]|nr:hypothetical protein M8J77_000586 [Diaphorina citri]
MRHETFGDLTASKFLLDHDASISCTAPSTHDTALHIIAAHNYPTMLPVAKVLLERGLSPDLKNVQGYTPLHLCVLAHNEELFSLLLSRGVNLNVTDVKGHPPLYYACLDLTDEDSVKDSFASRILERGSNANPVYEDDSTLLHQLIVQEREYPAIYLSSYVSNLDHQDSKGFTVLHLAAQYGLVRLVSKLIECGANLNVQTTLSPFSSEQERYKLTALHCAVLGSQPAVVEILLQHKDKVDVNLLDSNGDSPLSLSLWEGQHSLVPPLVGAGADLNLRNVEGSTLLHQVIQRGDTGTALILIQSGADIDAR